MGVRIVRACSMLRFLVFVAFRCIVSQNTRSVFVGFIEPFIEQLGTFSHSAVHTTRLWFVLPYSRWYIPSVAVHFVQFRFQLQGGFPVDQLLQRLSLRANVGKRNGEES
uniref:Secreted peptide n=1 Tax=Anopheles braziliensis TaxID=58242 RepID=A0A2M3ZL88_9DIPT